MVTGGEPRTLHPVWGSYWVVLILPKALSLASRFIMGKTDVARETDFQIKSPGNGTKVKGLWAGNDLMLSQVGQLSSEKRPGHWELLFLLLVLLLYNISPLENQ